MFDLQQPQWSDIGGQYGGQTESSYKYIMRTEIMMIVNTLLDH